MIRTLKISIVLALSPLVALAASIGNVLAKDPFIARQMHEIDQVNAAGQWAADWDSLTKHKIPEWFADAKFGIYAHWGVYTVPAFGNEWYPRNMYLKNNPTHKHHLETYGPLSMFGYKDFVPMLKAEKFDADEWAELYELAGAKFAGPVAEHHDGVSMWASRINRWNVNELGPKRDITGELVAALRKRDIKIITSFHHAFNIQGYYTAEEGWDTADPMYADLYGKFEDQTLARDRWLIKVKEVIDAYQPDQIWFDFGLQKIPDDYKQRMAAYYYNHEAKWGKPVIITRKGTHLPDGVGAMDIERGKMTGMADELWQTDDSVATNSWCWVEGLKLKNTRELVHELIDIVSKNGVLLLNVSPKADGSFPDDQREQLLNIGRWLKVNGEAIYATRPWKFHGEGPNLFDRGRGLGKISQNQVVFSAKDIRYTQDKDGRTLYAIALGLPQGELTLTAVKVNKVSDNASVRLLGMDEPLKFTVNDTKQLVIDASGVSPSNAPCKYAYSLKLVGFEVDVQPDAVKESPKTEMVHD
jgi:alpha-L-fucosidase